MFFSSIFLVCTNIRCYFPTLSSSKHCFYLTTILFPPISNSFTYDYLLLAINFAFAFVLCVILLIVSFFLSSTYLAENEKTSEYECGFEPFDHSTRQPFDVQFYLVGILFLIFDVEVALLFPWSIHLYIVGSFGFWARYLFLTVLTLGFLYEWNRGALTWPHLTE